jgi:V8-like Glu-specific endopeptidase
MKCNGLYTYELDIESGKSGGPLLSFGTQNAMGVYIFGFENKSNYAAPITAEFINWVRNNSPA